MAMSAFNEKYFEGFAKYGERERHVKLSYLDVLRWASKNSSFDILQGAGKKALDVGCAYGYVMDLLSSFGYEVYGVDVSNFALERAAEFLRGKGHRINLILHDADEPLPFKHEFRLITCFEILEHLVNPVVALKGMWEALEAGGAIIVTTPNKFAIYHKLLGQDKSHISINSFVEWRSILSRFSGSKMRVECYKYMFPFSVRGLKVPLVGDCVRILLEKRL